MRGTGGLDAGTRIVTAGIHRLTQGQHVPVDRVSERHELVQPFRLGLKHRSLVLVSMIAFMAAGLYSYLQLGRQEDPVLHHQDDGHPGAMAGRISAGDGRQVIDEIRRSSKSRSR